MNPFTLSGKRILVTGASSGIGRACAILAAELGANVVLTGRRLEALEETRLRMTNSDAQVVIAGDITSFDFVRRLVGEAGRIDGFVHAAGIGPMLPVSMLTAEHVESVMRTNYHSFLELMKYYSKSKYHGEKFSVVAVSSVSACVGWPGGSVYCGSKGALCATVRALAVELAPKGIRANSVCPSNIKTPMFDTGAVEMNGDVALAELLKKQPLGLGLPEQVAAPVCFLLSDAASFITGISLPVDGGYLAQ